LRLCAVRTYCLELYPRQCAENPRLGWNEKRKLEIVVAVEFAADRLGSPGLVLADVQREMVFGIGRNFEFSHQLAHRGKLKCDFDKQLAVAGLRDDCNRVGAGMWKARG